jgi:hypothetical protein
MVRREFPSFPIAQTRRPRRATTGKRDAMASSTTLPKVSVKLEKAKMSDAA